MVYNDVNIVYNVYIMLYTSTQAAQFLGITKHAVKVLVKASKLKDVAVVKPGVSRHAMRLQLAELKEYKKQNNLKEKPSTPVVRKSVPVLTPGAGIKTQLDRIESKLDALLKLWS